MAENKADPGGQAEGGVKQGPEDALALEIAKVIFSNNFDIIKNTSQMLQAITTFFLTVYTGFIVQTTTRVNFSGFTEWAALSMPIIFWVFSLVASFILVMLHLKHGETFIAGEIRTTVEAYEKIINRRRRLIAIPGWITFAGVLLFFVALIFVVLPKTIPRSPPTAPPSGSAAASCSPTGSTNGPR